MPPTTPTIPTAAPVNDASPTTPRVPNFKKLVTTYLGFILKNVIGWTLIIAAPILGIALPGPGGIPVFLIGFALVTFPGKRRITTRFMRGRRLPVDSPLFTGLITFFSVAVTAALMALAWNQYEWIASKLPLREWRVEGASKVVAVCLLALPVTILVSWVGLVLLNYVLGWIPRLRRMVRPALRKWGVRLLPTRRKLIGGRTEIVQDEILGIDDTQVQRLRRFWGVMGPWLLRLVTVSMTLGIIYLIVIPVVRQWGEVERRIGRLDVVRVGLAVGLFAASLLAFRAVAWQAILRGFGRRVPASAAARIWSLSHLARLVPGRLHQVVRMELARRYGPSATQANVAHRLENTLTMLAALLIGGSAAWVAAYDSLPEGWRPALVGLAALSPLLLIGAAPSVFYRLVPAQGGLWRDPRGRPQEKSFAGPTRLRGPWLLATFFWLALGLVAQGLAVWLLVGPPLQAAGRPWMVVGAWALAWAAGHFAPWSPAGLGVREVVFVAALSVLLPSSLRDQFAATTPQVRLDVLTFAGSLVPAVTASLQAWQDIWWAFLFFLALLLRLATTAAELMLATLATLLDWRGMTAVGDRYDE